MDSAIEMLDKSNFSGLAALKRNLTSTADSIIPSVNQTGSSKAAAASRAMDTYAILGYSLAAPVSVGLAYLISFMIEKASGKRGKNPEPGKVNA